MICLSRSGVQPLQHGRHGTLGGLDPDRTPMLAMSRRRWLTLVQQDRGFRVLAWALLRGPGPRRRGSIRLSIRRKVP